MDIADASLAAGGDGNGDDGGGENSHCVSGTAWLFPLCTFAWLFLSRQRAPFGGQGAFFPPLFDIRCIFLHLHVPSGPKDVLQAHVFQPSFLVPAHRLLQATASRTAFFRLQTLLAS